MHKQYMDLDRIKSVVINAEVENLHSDSFAKSLLSSSSAVNLEKLSSPKGFQPGSAFGALSANGASGPAG